MSKKLKVNDRVVVQFLGVKHECQVVGIRPDSRYDLRKKDGIIIPNAPWQNDMQKKAPWFIIAKIADGQSMPIEPEILPNSEEINKSELDEKIEQQKQFVRGRIKK